MFIMELAQTISGHTFQQTTSFGLRAFEFYFDGVLFESTSKTMFLKKTVDKQFLLRGLSNLYRLLST